MYKPSITIPVDNLQYDGNKNRRRTQFLRQFSRLSRLQRLFIYCLAFLLIVYLLLHLGQSTRQSQSASDSDEIVVLHKPTRTSLDPVKSIRRVKESIQKQVDNILQPEIELGADDDTGNDSVGEGGNEAPAEQEKELAGVQEKMEAGLVMPKPRIFEGPENDRQRSVVKAFQHGWKAYEKYAWGHDELKPLTKGFSEWFQIGLTLVDSLDTMYIMGLTEEFDKARRWVSEKLTFDKDVDVNLFEITIRAVGGLLSAFHLSGDDVFRDKAIDLGERLMGAFKTQSGVPFSDVNMKTRLAHEPKWGPDSSSAEVTTIQLEFRDLSYVSGDPKFESAAFKVSEHFHKLPKKEGLIPIFVNALTGEFRPHSTITFGARGDSYYEYLLKQWIQVGKSTDWLRIDFEESMASAAKYLIRETVPNKLVFVGELIGERFSAKMDALVCFLPGTLALGTMHGLPKEHLDLAERLIRTCHEMYVRNPTHLGPEIAHFKIQGGNEVPDDTVDIFIKDADAHALLRPEYVESLFYLYRVTKNSTYQDWGWDVFEAIERHAKIPGAGYASIEDVRTAGRVRHRDKMESFLLSETFKYLYLLFADDQSVLPLNEYVFNTEAHPLPIRKDASFTA